MPNYRIKQIIDTNGDPVFLVQRKRLWKWWDVYIVEKYDAEPWIFEFMFGSPKCFYKFQTAKDWIMRRLKGEEAIYHYYPFETNNN